MDVINTTLGDPAAGFTAEYAELETKNEMNVSGHVSLNYFAGKDWQWQLALGRGVRTANMIERYINHFTVGLDPYGYLGNPNLRPEANHQVELSALNLLDENYYEHLSRVYRNMPESGLLYEPGRNFTFFIAYKM